MSKVLIDSDGPKLVVEGFPYALDKVVAVKNSLSISEEPLKKEGSN